MAKFIPVFTILLHFLLYNILFYFFQNHESSFFLLIIKKFKTITIYIFKSLTMDILCATFGYCLKHKNSSHDFMFQMQVLHYFILFFLFLNIFHHNGKTMVEGRWDLNDNGPSFHNTFMLRWGTYYNPSPCNSHIIFGTNYI